MDHIERLELVERVQRASEQQAKRTLNSMILKCKVHEVTIARAIKDAVERHTPTPTIVYQDPTSEDEDEPAPTSPRKESKKKRKGQDGSSKDEEDVPSPTSNKRRSTRRGDIHADPLVEQLILKNTKPKLKGNKKRSSNNEEELSSPDASKKNKSKHASKLRAETEQRTRKSSKRRPSMQEDPPFIDLVTSSDDETCDIEQSKNESLDDKSSDNNSQNDSSSYSDSSDDGDSEDEPQGDTFAEGIGPSPDGPNKKANETHVRNNGGDGSADRSVKIPMDKASKQVDINKTNCIVLGKKRKMPELTVGDVHNDQHAKSTPIVHINKRSKQNHPQESQRSSEDRTCRKCGVLFPSLAQLLKHRVYCKDLTTTFGRHHRSEPLSDNRPLPVSQVQKNSNPTGDIFTDEPHNIQQLPSRPRPRTPTDRGLSVPPPSFVHEPNNFPRGPTPTPLALARSSSGLLSSPPNLVNHPVPKSTLHGSLDNQSRLANPGLTRQRLPQKNKEEAMHPCKFCNKWFKDGENSAGDCKRHPGQYGPLIERQLRSVHFKGHFIPGQPYIAWNCCFRQGEDAPPCFAGIHRRSMIINR